MGLREKITEALYEAPEVDSRSSGKMERIQARARANAVMEVVEGRIQELRADLADLLDTHGATDALTNDIDRLFTHPNAKET